MTQTLIGTEKLMLTLSGRIEIEASPFGDIVILSYPGVGLKAQRACLDGRCLLDVETLPELPRPKVTVERAQDPQADYLKWAVSTGWKVGSKGLEITPDPHDPQTRSERWG